MSKKSMMADGAHSQPHAGQQAQNGEEESPIARLETALAHLAFVVEQRNRPSEAEKDPAIMARVAQRIVELEARVRGLLDDALEKEEGE